MPPFSPATCCDRPTSDAPTVGVYARAIASRAWVDASRSRLGLAGACRRNSCGGHSAAPRIQVIFDANCPYCARLYLKLKREYPEVPVRWVPIAYLVTSSAPRAAAILDSQNPQASLDRNFVHYVYDWKKSHGGYPIPDAPSGVLPPANVALKKSWLQWGGATPMIVVRNADGNTIRFLGERDPTIATAMHDALGSSGAPMNKYSANGDGAQGATNE